MLQLFLDEVMLWWGNSKSWIWARVVSELFSLPLSYTHSTRANYPALPRGGAGPTLLSTAAGLGRGLLSYTSPERHRASSLTSTPPGTAVPCCSVREQGQLFLLPQTVRGRVISPALTPSGRAHYIRARSTMLPR